MKVGQQGSGPLHALSGWDTAFGSRSHYLFDWGNVEMEAPCLTAVTGSAL